MSEAVTTRAASASATREAIGKAGRRLFNRQGYAGTSVRQIAAAAGVDPALVIRYYGSKERLFLETMPVEGRFDHVTNGPLEGLGRRLVGSLLHEGRDLTLSIWRSMLRASDSELVRERLVSAMEEMFIVPLGPRLEGPHAELRARLVAAQIAGILDALAILADDRITGAPADLLVALYGDAIQTLVDPPTEALLDEEN